MMTKNEELQKFDVPIPTADGKTVAEIVSIMVPTEWDEAAQDWVLTPVAIDLIEETKSRHMGLLTPREIRSLREREGLTQAEIGTILQIGAKTWTRWESGRQRPSRSLNLLLRILQTRAVSCETLAEIGGSVGGQEPVATLMK